MTFAYYGPSSVRGAKIDWDRPLELTRQIRYAMHPHDLAHLRPGILRRGYVAKGVTHSKGSLVFAAPDDSGFWIES